MEIELGPQHAKSIGTPGEFVSAGPGSPRVAVSLAVQEDESGRKTLVIQSPGLPLDVVTITQSPPGNDGDDDVDKPRRSCCCCCCGKKEDEKEDEKEDKKSGKKRKTSGGGVAGVAGATKGLYIDLVNPKFKSFNKPFLLAVFVGTFTFTAFVIMTWQMMESCDEVNMSGTFETLAEEMALQNLGCIVQLAKLTPVVYSTSSADDNYIILQECFMSDDFYPSLGEKNYCPEDLKYVESLENGEELDDTIMFDDFGQPISDPWNYGYSTNPPWRRRAGIEEVDPSSDSRLRHHVGAPGTRRMHKEIFSLDDGIPSRSSYRRRATDPCAAYKTDFDNAITTEDKEDAIKRCIDSYPVCDWDDIYGQCATPTTYEEGYNEFSCIVVDGPVQEAIEDSASMMAVLYYEECPEVLNVLGSALGWATFIELGFTAVTVGLLMLCGVIKNDSMPFRLIVRDMLVKGAAGAMSMDNGGEDGGDVEEGGEDDKGDHQEEEEEDVEDVEGVLDEDEDEEEDDEKTGTAPKTRKGRAMKKKAASRKGKKSKAARKGKKSKAARKGTKSEAASTSDKEEEEKEEEVDEMQDGVEEFDEMHDKVEEYEMHDKVEDFNEMEDEVIFDDFPDDMDPSALLSQVTEL